MYDGVDEQESDLVKTTVLAVMDAAENGMACKK